MRVLYWRHRVPPRQQVPFVAFVTPEFSRSRAPSFEIPAVSSDFHAPSWEDVLTASVVTGSSRTIVQVPDHDFDLRYLNASLLRLGSSVSPQGCPHCHQGPRYWTLVSSSPRVPAISLLTQCKSRILSHSHSRILSRVIREQRLHSRTRLEILKSTPSPEPCSDKRPIEIPDSRIAHVVFQTPDSRFRIPLTGPETRRDRSLEKPLLLFPGLFLSRTRTPGLGFR